ncbi:MAG: small-conductance mechanosensitive ion channel [Parcubacteria group bacterium Gr01-1014_30]|nr:MAG: small-conductance mechanosensitive ion channel [Parcubacteria group bacterium Gr01-1014_30]
MLLDWYFITVEALSDLWRGFLIFVPKLIGAAFVFLVGWVIAAGVGRVIDEVLKRLKFNQLFEKGVWKDALEKAEIKVDASGFVGALVKWVLVIVFLLVAVEILGLVAFAGFLTNVLSYLPNVVVAALIFVVAVIIADLAEKIVRASVESVRVGYGHLAGSIVKWAIWVFAILAILRQLLIVPEMVEALFSALIFGVVALFVLSAGIAFGLGGKEAASEILQGLMKKLKK